MTTDQAILLPVITLHRPWSDWIALGLKTIETRTHNRFGCLIGRRIGIHSGRRYDRNASVSAYPYIGLCEYLPMSSAGRILCTAFVERFRLLGPADAPRALIECNSPRFGLFLKDVQIVPDEPWTRIKGAQGIQYVNVPADYLSRGCATSRAI